MNILYSGDSNMRDGLLISILSLLEHVEEPLHIYILTAAINNGEKQFAPLGQEDADFFNNLVKKENPENDVRRVDITDLFYSNLPVSNMDTIFTPYCMLRLYSDLVDLPERILYMDTDIICRKDFSEFYRQGLENKELVGVLDYYGRWLFRQSYWHFGPDYINSGLLLLNMPRIKETSLFSKCRQLCREKKMFMPDQSALNKLSDFRGIAPRKFNEQRQLRGDTVFQHFTTSFRFWPTVHAVTVKPWDVSRVHSELGLHEYDDLLNRYETLIREMELA